MSERKIKWNKVSKSDGKERYSEIKWIKVSKSDGKERYSEIKWVKVSKSEIDGKVRKRETKKIN